MVSVAVELEPAAGVAARPWRGSVAVLWIAVVAALFVLVGYPMLWLVLKALATPGVVGMPQMHPSV